MFLELRTELETLLTNIPFHLKGRLADKSWLFRLALKTSRIKSLQVKRTTGFHAKKTTAFTGKFEF